MKALDIYAFFFYKDFSFMVIFLSEILILRIEIVTFKYKICSLCRSAHLIQYAWASYMWLEIISQKTSLSGELLYK